MTDELQLLKKRFQELARRAFSQQRYTYTEFLSLAEQDALLTLRLEAGSAAFALYGGFEAAERKLAQFGTEELCGYPEEPPIVCVHVEPVSQKFADALTHRDFLGALMGLGVRRSVLGDIVLKDNAAYLLCLDSISGFITEQFTQVKRTTVKCTILASVPALAAGEPEPKSVNVASERLDAIIAAVYKMSRGESQTLIEQDKVFIGGRLTENTSCQPSPGDIISVRGLGRFVYEGISKETKKGRLFVNVRVY